MDGKCYSLHYEDLVSRVMHVKPRTVRGSRPRVPVRSRPVAERIGEVVAAWAGKRSTA